MLSFQSREFHKLFAQLNITVTSQMFFAGFFLHLITFTKKRNLFAFFELFLPLIGIFSSIHHEVYHVQCMKTSLKIIHPVRKFNGLLK